MNVIIEKCKGSHEPDPMNHISQNEPNPSNDVL